MQSLQMGRNFAIDGKVSINQSVFDIHPGMRLDPAFWIKVDEVARTLFEQMDPHDFWENLDREEQTMYHKAVVQTLHAFDAIYVDLDNPGRMLEE